ncbi:hypothetical protein OG874_00350 [Nocardia sp. NBC_00565]|uniref:hypothetical protein n=1 Tax=Nocardia sp. NBC_00565 TaxID=2975993 RepID=UPI002E816AF1|nr:hypothetical protein [Nocardia sp. NBC_00565]WUC03705.1 hypothetical protein OG874_00350 [Nocardia sp. NBC_00565]
MSAVRTFIMLGMAAIVVLAVATGRPASEVIVCALVLAAMLLGSAYLGRVSR